ncbi:hypothetical protein, partial [Pseudomonas aeruginosa]
ACSSLRPRPQSTMRLISRLGVAPRLDPGPPHLDEQDGGLAAAGWQVARRVVGREDHRVLIPEYEC